MAKCKKTHKKFDQINVIPFIDIMLVLLVMVLTTATFIKQGIIPVELPKSTSSQKNDKDKKEIDVYIKADGTFYINKTKVDPKELESKLSTIPTQQTVVLRSDKNTKFQNFVTVMDILKKLKHKQLYIVTKK